MARAESDLSPEMAAELEYIERAIERTHDGRFRAWLNELRDRLRKRK